MKKLHQDGKQSSQLQAKLSVTETLERMDGYLKSLEPWEQSMALIAFGQQAEAYQREGRSEDESWAAAFSERQGAVDFHLCMAR